MNELMQPYFIWHRAWRLHVSKAKENPEEQDLRCQAALMANAMYVITYATRSW